MSCDSNTSVRRVTGADILSQSEKLRSLSMNSQGKGKIGEESAETHFLGVPPVQSQLPLDVVLTRAHLDQAGSQDKLAPTNSAKKTAQID